MIAADLPHRLASRIRKQSDGCWLWTGSTNPDGYGQVWWAGTMRGAHRAVWMALHGTIEPGRVLDHECHNRDASCTGGKDCLHRRCVRPSHLRLTSAVQNVADSPTSTASINAAKTHCPHGHEYSPENTVRVSNGRAMVRRCRTCLNGVRRARRQAVAS